MARNDFNSPRLYVSGDLKAGAELLATREALNYLRNVLRLGDGAKLLVFNGRDGEWRARLAAKSRREAALVVESPVRPQTPCGDLHYAFAPI
jgi:16S rRNA (uracil1498-N3)-methyltransferase